MRISTLFISVMGAAAIAVAVSACGASGPAGTAIGQPPPVTPSPAPNFLYVDHHGTFYEYRLPLSQGSKPMRTLTEWPDLRVAPVIAADQFGNVALASPTELRLFRAPIVSFEPSHAQAKLKLTSAMTGVGSFGADLSDIEYDPNENLWLFNNLGGQGGITMLRPPIKQSSVAAVFIPFGAPGSKTAGFTTITQGRFDINATLYVYASTSSTPPRSRLWKVAFPYAKPPGTTGLNLEQADFVDSSEWPPTASSAPSLLLGQYTGQLQSPKPGSPPSPPVDVASQFDMPLDPQVGLFPNEHIDAIVGAVAADAYRYSFYALDGINGALDVYQLPMQNHEKPKISLSCLAGTYACGQAEHAFLAP
jgi:hypothetical protein